MVKVTMAIAAYVFVMGQCKTWTLDSGLDSIMDSICGLEF